MNPTLPITIRPPVPDDYGYILETWSKNFHESHPTNFIPNPIYVPYQTKIINSILQTCPPIVACLDDEPDKIVGYLVAEPHDQDNLIIHYGCVKGIFRRLGVMKELLAHYDSTDKNLICTHYFGLFKTLRERYHLIYDPTLLEQYNHA